MRELDRRTTDGIDVRLLWRPSTDDIVVALSDERTSEAFAFVVPKAAALDAFHHPYAYLGRWRLEAERPDATELAA